MLDPTPVWTYSRKKSLANNYNHVHLLPDHVVGEWFCVERPTGRFLWQSKLYRPDTIFAVDSGVIVATELRSDGPWTLYFGCYGISLDSGALIWASHGSGIRGVLARICDLIPGCTNELRDAPVYVQDGQVFCNSGRVIDVKTGHFLKMLTPDIVYSHKKTPSDRYQFYSSDRLAMGEGIVLEEDLRLRYERIVEPQNGVLKFVANNSAGEVLWTFSTEMLGRQIDGNLHSWRLVPPFLYLVVSNGPRHRPHPSRKHWVLPNPTLWHFVTLDLATGKVLQDFSLGNEKQEECRIEDMDDHGILISKTRREFSYFTRMTS